MHELGILNHVLKTLEKTMVKEQLTHIDKVVLQVGEISGVIPSYIEECFKAAIYKTQFEDLKLEIEIIPGIVRCNECSEEFNGYIQNLKCPNCNSQSLTPISGLDFLIKEIHAC